MAEPKKAGLFRYLKEAFMFRWNLLLLGGASAAAVISGHPDIAAAAAAPPNTRRFQRNRNASLR